MNSLEVHTENQIAAIFSGTFKEERPVAMAIHTVEEYNQAALQAGVVVNGWQEQEPHWTHQGSNGTEEASYVHNPKDGNRSHCLVKYTCSFDDNAEFRFARRMAYKPRFGLH